MKNNDSDSLLDRLLQAARADARETSRAEFGFETRLLARLREERGGSIFSWAWKLAPFFAAVALAAGLWSRTTAVRAGTEAHLLSEAANGGDERALVLYMTGDRR